MSSFSFGDVMGKVGGGKEQAGYSKPKLKIVAKTAEQKKLKAKKEAPKKKKLVCYVKKKKDGENYTTCLVAQKKAKAKAPAKPKAPKITITEAPKEKKETSKPVDKPTPYKPTVKKINVGKEPAKPKVANSSNIVELLKKYPNEATIIGDIWKKTIDRKNPSGFKKMTTIELYEKHLKILKNEEFKISARATFGKKEKMDTNKPEIFIKRYEDRVFNFLKTKEALEK